MLSGTNDNYLSNRSITHIGGTSATNIVENAIWINGLNLEQEQGVVIGDYVTVSGASNGANNFSDRQITEVVILANGSYVVVDGAALVDEFGTSLTVHHTKE